MPSRSEQKWKVPKQELRGDQDEELGVAEPHGQIRELEVCAQPATFDASPPSRLALRAEALLIPGCAEGVGGAAQYPAYGSPGT